jgi:hypothetical protein|tara:strand:+ start:3899 stop:4915 length:1017 start_codon:yes stop_codon:yes gene_type:complete
MSDTEIINEEPVISESVQQSQEDKFFGVQTEIKNDVPEDLQVEVIDDTPQEDRRPAKDESALNVPEIDDDALDKEIADYSERAGKRIAQIKYEYHEERRAKEAATRESQEAVKRLQTLMSENQRLQAMVQQGGEVLNKQAYNNALWAKQNAQEQFKKAYEEGNADEMTKAQELLSRATLAEQQSPTMAQSLQQQIAENLPQQPIQEQQIDPDMQAWSSQNPWFMSTVPEHQEMTSYAMTIDQRLRNQGILPETQSKLYYEEVDKAMRREYPSFFGVSTTEVEEPIQEKRQPSTVVASATRDSSNKKPSQIRLTQTQVKLARQLGISPEQYANQLLKEA